MHVLSKMVHLFYCGSGASIVGGFSSITGAGVGSRASSAIDFIACFSFVCFTGATIEDGAAVVAGAGIAAGASTLGPS